MLRDRRLAPAKRYHICIFQYVSCRFKVGVFYCGIRPPLGPPGPCGVAGRLLTFGMRNFLFNSKSMEWLQCPMAPAHRIRSPRVALAGGQ